MKSCCGAKSAAQPAMQAPVPAMTGSESYTGPDVDTVEYRVGSSDAATHLLVWLPGSGQRADNEILRRLVNALHEVCPCSAS